MSDLLLCNLRLAMSCRGERTCMSLAGADATLAMILVFGGAAGWGFVDLKDGARRTERATLVCRPQTTTKLARKAPPLGSPALDVLNE
jgi:hypothetical protein